MGTHQGARSRSVVGASVLGLAAVLWAAGSAAGSVVIAASNTPFVDISATGTSVGTIGDDTENVLAGATLTGAGFNGNGLLAGGMSIRVGNNGAVFWGNSATDTFTNATEIGYVNASPAGTVPNPFATMTAINNIDTGNGGLGPRQMLCPLWDDNYPSATGSIKWQVIGGNLIIQWTGENFYNTRLTFPAGTVTYEVIVYGGRTIASGQPLVEFIYNDTFIAASQYQNDGGSATIGYKNWGLNASGNDVEFGTGGGVNTLADPAFGDASMHPKIAGWVESSNSALPHSVVIKGATAACPVDVDHNGSVEPADISLFVTTWFNDLTNGTFNADFDANGSVQPADISLFVSQWFSALTAGHCP